MAQTKQETQLTFSLSDHIFLKVDRKLHKVLFKEILFIESFGDYLHVYTDQGKITLKERISHLEEQLPSELFLRVHRGFIVSVKKITAILSGQLEIEQHKIPIGRNYKTEVDKIIH